MREVTVTKLGDPGEHSVLNLQIIGNLLGMTACANCGDDVDSRWKFCLNCGASMAGGNGAALAIPGAIRRERAAPRRIKLDWQLTVGVILAAAGIAMIAYLVLALALPHG
jgi:uncharacterized membrane protein YvbJ